MANEQTDSVAQERIIAQFQSEQRTKKIKEKNERRRKYLKVWENLRPSITGAFCFLIIMGWVWTDFEFDRLRRYWIVVLFGVIWLFQIEGRIISVQRDLARLRRRENKGGE